MTPRVKAPRSELVIVPTYKRNVHLQCCLKRIRAQDSQIAIVVFSDRGENNWELRSIVHSHQASLIVLPPHDFYGNSYCVMEALRWASMLPFELIHVNEDDVMQHPDCLAWHREQHALFDDIFASCGWVFNLHAPIADGVMFAPWLYSPNYCVRKDKLALIAQHANPRYYTDMRGYVLRSFPDSILHNGGRQLNTNFMEQDAVIQYCLMKDGTQVAWNGIAKVDHIGAAGYNKPHGTPITGPLNEAVNELERFIADEYERAAIFGKPIVERECGHELPKRRFQWRVKTPDGWETDFVTETSRKVVPIKIHSVTIPQGSTIEAL